ncbi:MAG: PEP-CTERM sorting domain-containing protein [Akkermansiaceae bacterium]|nr:PEP-CTERM sorting domain-containing protein [Akkermansiaceae bacterium]
MKKTISALLVAAATVATSAAATTILIDYNDGLANGVHDAAVRNGGFETRTGSTYNDGVNWTNNGVATSTTSLYGTLKRTGTYGGTTSLASNPTNDTGHTIALGDVIELTFWARNSGTTDRVIVWSLGDINGTTFTPFATDGTGNVTVNGAFQMFSASKTVGSGDALIGQSLAVQFRRTVGDGNFPAVDDVTLSVTPVPEPSSAALLGLGGLALILRRRR